MIGQKGDKLSSLPSLEKAWAEKYPERARLRAALKDLGKALRAAFEPWLLPLVRWLNALLGGGDDDCPA